MRVQDMATPLDEYRAPRECDPNNSPKALLNGAIQALLAEDTIRERVSQARGCLKKLERFNGEADEELADELRCILDDIEKKIIEGAADVLSSEDEQDLTERLFSLYLDVSEGMLIW